MKWSRRPVDEAEDLDRVDAWAPPLGFGYWRTLYAECCDAVLAYDRVVATMPAGILREKLLELRPGLPALLDRARCLAEIAARLFPSGPARDPLLLELLAGDPVKNVSGQLTTVPPDPGLRTAVLAVRDELWRVADGAARLAVRLRENPTATDVTTWLKGLAAGVASARRAGWTPIGYAEDGDP